MNKAELIEKISKDATITKVQAAAALDSFIEAVTETLQKEERLTLIGFGSFSVYQRAERNGRNPKNNTMIKIEARKVPKFKAGKEFSEKVAEAKI